MRARIRTLVTWSALPTLVISLLLGTLPAAADESRSLVIGVDNNTPAGENFAFLDYYPRAGVRVHNGDVVGFRFTPPVTSDQIHTATLGAVGQSAEATAGQLKYQPGPDVDDPGFQLQFPNALFNPSNPPAAFGGCGTQAQPCSYDGSTDVNSGILCRAACPNSEYFFKFNLASVPAGGLTIHYVCLIHGPVMQGTIDIVPGGQDASTQRELNLAARVQYGPQIGRGFEAKADALRQARKTGTVMAGAEDSSGRVQVLEMLPHNFKAAQGAFVSWLAPANNEIHTVTFPNGSGSDSVDPIPFVCEGTPDTPASFASGPPCGDPSKLEVHLNPQPQGATVIATPTTIGSSGVIAGPATPFLHGYPFSFPNAGTFTYQCRIHDHMTGTITVGREDDEGE